MTDVISTLLGLSLAGSLLAAVLFLLKPVLRGRVSQAAAYYLWLLVLLRLCLPVGLTLSLPEVRTPVPVQAATGQQRVTGGQATPAVPVRPEAPQPVQENATPTPVPETVPRETTRPALVFALWAVGAVGVGGWYVLGYLRVRRAVEQSALPAGAAARRILLELEPRQRVRLVESSAVRSPLLLGVLQPTIVLPVGLTDPARLRDILAHELTHARRQDLLFKWFAAFAASVHWFNPLLPFVRREIGRACELACDEAVVRSLAPSARKQYGETLLLLAANAPMGSLPLAVTLCEEKESLEERLVSIVKTHRRTPAAVVLTVGLVLVLGGCALFSGAQQAKEPQGLTDPESGMTINLDMTREEVEMIDTVNGVFQNAISYQIGGSSRWTTEAGISHGSSLEAVQKEYQRWPIHDLFQAGSATYFSCQGSPDMKEDSFWLYIVAGEDACVEKITLQRTYAATITPPTTFTNPSTGAQVELYQTRAEIENILGPGKDLSNEPFIWPGTTTTSDIPVYVEEDAGIGTMAQGKYGDTVPIADPDGEPLGTWTEVQDTGNIGEMDSRAYGYAEGEDLPEYTEADLSSNIISPRNSSCYTVFAYGEGADTLYVHYWQDKAVTFSTHYITDFTADPRENLNPFHWQLDGLRYGATPEEAQQVYPEGRLEDRGTNAGLNIQVFQYYNGVHQVALGVYDGEVGSIALMLLFPS